MGWGSTVIKIVTGGGSLTGELLQSALMGATGDVDDEGAIDDAVDYMYSLCANAGQESIIEIGEEGFREWAIEFLEEPEVDPSPRDGGYLDDVDDDMWEGTHEIWHEGIAIIHEQSHAHDTEDEQGEGTGDEADDGGFIDAVERFFGG